MYSLKAVIIGSVYRRALKPLLFSRDPEDVHDVFIKLGSQLGKNSFARQLTKWLFCYEDKSLHQKILGVSFPNPVGLSAGFDKDANLVQILPAIGFGFHQIGTVTYGSYKGNPRPRLYRLPKSKGLVVYYGLKNIGVKKIIGNLRNTEFEIPTSFSIGKTNSDSTASEKAGITDYVHGLQYVADSKRGDFYTINISCPNTFGGEPFTTPARLDRLLSELKKIKIDKPLFLKMPTDKGWPQFKKLLDVAKKHKIDGLIIANLIKDHKSPDVHDTIPVSVKGGISGKPTWDISNELIGKTYKSYKDEFVIIGVGGIFSAEDAYEKVKQGASLVQLITGMIYQGPQVIGEINRGLVQLLKQDGYKNISDAIGAYHKG